MSSSIYQTTVDRTTVGRTAFVHRVAASLLTLLLLTSACVPQKDSASQVSAVATLRKSAATSRDPDALASWLLAELISPGGSANEAASARKRLDQARKAGSGMLPSLAAGIDDALHGELASAPDHFLSAVRAARGSSEPYAPLVAWFAVHRALALKGNTSKLWERWQAFAEEAIRDPKNLGFRARDALVQWSLNEAWDRANSNVEELSVPAYGCLRNVRLAGPFGVGLGSDTYSSFAAESPEPWPTRFPLERGRSAPPRILKVEQTGCTTAVTEAVNDGIFYAETFLELSAPTQVLLVARSAHALWVNNTQVMERNITEWGAALSTTAHLRLVAGRHRILVRTASSEVALRALAEDGTPLAVRTSNDAALGYSNVRPELLPSKDLLPRYVSAQGTLAESRDIEKFMAGFLAHAEGLDDVASVLHEPLIADNKVATGPALYQAAVYVEGDPIFNRSQTADLARELYRLAVRKDPRLWTAHLELASHTAASKGLTDAVSELKALSLRFPQVPSIAANLANLYGQLGWRPEYVRTIKGLVQRFPENLESLYAAVQVYDEEGASAKVDELIARIRRLEPDSEILVTRAVEREDYEQAVAELERMLKRHPERKDVEQRIYELLIRAGKKQESVPRLSQLLQKEPKNSELRLAIADALFARGEHDALYKTLALAVQAGADYGELAGAIDLVEGVTELEPYRVNGPAVIAAYEAAGKELSGTAARVLDYSVVWAHTDGSSRMLEHEILKIQSAEAISRFAEQKADGLILHMRVIKKDGRTLEPEPVAGKETVTFPHLEVGDYIETEQLYYLPGDGVGQMYAGPRWFFREENVGYARSEFVLIAPKNKEIQIEVRGDVPTADISEDGQIVVRRWRVDHSPAAPKEPFSSPISEFLPSVSVAWGVREQDRLTTLSGRVRELVPVDPRVRRIAERIVEDIPKHKTNARARALYRWIQENITDSEEVDGRRVIVGKTGNRWQAMVMLCRAIGIKTRFVISKNRLASPPVGPISEAVQFSVVVLRLETEAGPVWLTLDDKYAPFAYLPAEVRGMPGYELGGSMLSSVTLPHDGSQDSIVYSGKARLLPDGSAEVELTQEFHGKYAVRLRRGLAELAQNRLHDVLEAQVLGRLLHGARLSRFSIDNQANPDKPLFIRMSAKMQAFAELRGGTLVIAPPFVPNLSQLASLSERETPLLIGEATHQIVELDITLPNGARVSLPASSVLGDSGRKVKIQDSAKAGVLSLRREVQVPAARVQPDAYPAFVSFTRQADSALSREIPVQLDATP